MIHNDVLRSVRYMLDISDNKMVEIIKLGGMEVTKDDLLTYLKKDEEEGFVFCPDEVMAHFLDGLVIFKRGKDESRPPQPIETPVTNNIILKKLRVAFELRDDDIQALLQAVDLPMTKAELGALFRAPGHKHFRECGDQILRNFLRGLTLRERGKSD